jgi:hypothetical protein
MFRFDEKNGFSWPEINAMNAALTELVDRKMSLAVKNKEKHDFQGLHDTYQAKIQGYWLENRNAPDKGGWGYRNTVCDIVSRILTEEEADTKKKNLGLV